MGRKVEENFARSLTEIVNTQTMGTSVLRIQGACS